MPIQFACASCGKAYALKDEMAGRKGKCSACGAEMRVPDRAAPTHYREPAPEPEPTPARVEAIQAPSSPSHSHVVNVAVMPQPAAKGSNALGIASFVLGLLALLICWVPLLNLVSLPLLLIGGVLALVGVIVSAIGKTSGLTWPVIGAALNAAALGGFLVTTILLTRVVTKVGEGLQRASADANPVAKPAVVAPPAAGPGAAAAPTPPPPPEAPPSVGLGEVARLGDVEIEVLRVVKGKTPIVDQHPFPGRDGRSNSEDDFLSVFLLVKNVSPGRKLDYHTMGSSLSSFEAGSTLSDDLGNQYKACRFGISKIPEGQTVSESIYPGKTVYDHLVFELPVDAATSLTLELPAARAGGTKGNFRFVIPTEKIASK